MEYSQTALRYTTQLKPLRLNPYSNGILTDRIQSYKKHKLQKS